jgi:hypothetical protein
MLNQSSAIALSAKQAAELIGPSRSSAADVVQDSVAQLERQRKLALNEHKGSWNAVAETRLEDLRALIKNMPKLEPFLLRALAIYEGTGGFSAETCGEDIVISHVSLGTAGSKPVRLPVVIFLSRPPKKVYLATGLAR